MTSPAPAAVPRLKSLYRERVVPSMMERFGWKNPFQTPRLQKIVLNVGVKEARDNVQALDQVKQDMAAITGQAPQVRRAKKSISNFKLRQGMPIGVRATLRGDRMFEFLDRLVATALPRVRDFRGLSPKGFDGMGNYNLGLKEQLIFAEIQEEKSPVIRGMNITIVTNAGKDEVGLELLTMMGLPFRKAGRK